MKVGIVGAGIMGRLLACTFLKLGWTISLFAPSRPTDCSHAAAGLLTPVAELEKNPFIIFTLGNQAIQEHWPLVLNQLSAPASYFKQKGSIVVAHPRDHSELSRFIHLIAAKLPNPFFYQKQNATQLCSLEPALSSFLEGYYFPTEGQIDNQSLLFQLKKYLIQKGITWIKKAASQIHPRKVVTQDKCYDFNLVLDCRGLGGKSTFPHLRGIRGELIWLHAPDVRITRPIRLLHPRYNLYVVPRSHQRYLIGASEIESEDYSSISVRTTLECLTAVYSLHAGFSEARIIKSVTQCRPTLIDGLPKIKYEEGLIAINGLYRHGFLIAPTLAHEIALWVEGGLSRVHYRELWEST